MIKCEGEFMEKTEITIEGEKSIIATELCALIRTLTKDKIFTYEEIDMIIEESKKSINELVDDLITLLKKAFKENEN